MSIVLRQRDQVIDDAGDPVVNGYFYVGVSGQDPKANPITIYSDSALTTPISNPQRTDSYGRVPNDIYIAESAYSYLISDSADATIEGPSDRTLPPSGDSLAKVFALESDAEAALGISVGDIVQTTSKDVAGDRKGATWKAVADGTYTDGVGGWIEGATFLQGQNIQLEMLDVEKKEFDSITDMAAITVVEGIGARVNSGGRAGPFRATTADISTEVTADPQQGVYVAFASDPTGASGGWVRQYGQSIAAHPEIKVTWFGAVGDGVAVDDPAIQAAIDYAHVQYLRVFSGQGGTFPVKVMTVKIPAGVYRTQNEIIPNTAGYAIVNLEGDAESTLLVDHPNAGINVNPIDPGLALMTAPLKISQLKIQKYNPDKAAGSIGMYIERMTNMIVESVAIFGFDFGMQIEGAIDCLIDFRGKPVENCNFGMRVQQKTHTATGSILKPNLTKIRGGYFINNSSNAIIIRENPDESAVNRASGGVISIEDTNFQNASSGPTVIVETPGEVPGQGIVEFNSCWWEGHGNTALSLSNGKAVMKGCFIFDGSDPIILQDSTSKIVLEELHGLWTATPTDNCVVRRFDGSVDNDYIRQVTSRNVDIAISGISTVFLAKNNLIPDTSIPADLVFGATVEFERGTTGNLTGSGGFEDIIDLNAGGRYIFSVQQSDGGNVWSGCYSVISSGASLVIGTIQQQNITLTGSGSSVRLTNTNPSDITLTWSATRIGL